MATISQASALEGAALAAWRAYLQSHAAILRELDAELVARHGITARDYEALLYLAQAERRRLPMHELANRTMLTPSGITRLVDGLVGAGFVERIADSTDARVSYALLTEAGYTKLCQAGCSHVAGIERLFLTHFSAEELDQLAELLRRLPGAIADGGGCTADPSDCAVL